ncbi:MAG TPA: hypothetical protein VKF16_02675 [Candidatus Dormibacteraeota bacterium]|nr:hypothetical protein [Candidatus Dormibacteraeota bacterium]
MIASELDRLVLSGRVTGYTVEEDTGYIGARVPTLTYRMYIDGPESHLNLGAFAAAMADLGTTMRLTRVQGAVAYRGAIWRSRQLCLTVEFAGEGAMGDALDIVYDRFVAAPEAAPGSWRFPDVRVTGAEPRSTAAAFAHHWPCGRDGAVVLSLDEDAPARGARTSPVHVLRSWVGYLDGGPFEFAVGSRSMALSIQ